MDEQGFINIDLPIPLTTEHKNERLVVALASAHIPHVPNVGLMDKRPWMGEKDEEIYVDEKRGHWCNLWVVEHCRKETYEDQSRDDDDYTNSEQERCPDDSVEKSTHVYKPYDYEQFSSTNTGSKYVITAKHASSFGLLKQMINNMNPIFKKQRLYPKAMECRRENALLGESYFTAADWIELFHVGDTILLRQKPGLCEFVYGESGVEHFKIELMLQLSEELCAVIGCPHRYSFLHGDGLRLPYDPPGLGNQHLMHLMMEGLEDSLVDGSYRPLLYSYPQNGVDHKPMPAYYILLKDTHNSGCRSERQRLRFWIEDIYGDVRPLHRDKNTSAEVTIELRWRRIILTSTAQSVVGSRPEAGMGMERMYQPMGVLN